MERIGEGGLLIIHTYRSREPAGRDHSGGSRRHDDRSASFPLWDRSRGVKLTSWQWIGIGLVRLTNRRALVVVVAELADRCRAATCEQG